MCITETSTATITIAGTSTNELSDQFLAMFPDPERPVWEQFFSKKHQQSYEGRPSDGIDTEIFRIFQRANFSRLSDIEGQHQPVENFLDPKDTIPRLWYNRLLPALVLATRLIKMTPEFFCIVAFGKMGRIDDGRIEDGSWGYARDEEGNWLYELEEGTDPNTKCQELFDRMSNIRFFTGKTPNDMENAYARASYGYWPYKESEKRVATAGVQLHSKWIDFFSRPDYDKVAADVKNRLLVHLAMVLVHELAHVWYGYRKLDYARQGNFKRYCGLVTAKEPYFYSDEERPEMGHAWGRYAFNAEQQLTNSGAPCYTQSSLLYLKPYGRWQGGAPKVEPKDEPEEKPFRVRVVDPCLVGAFLSKDCWDLFDKVETDSNNDEQIESLYIWERMEKAVAVRIFVEGAGRIPSLAELGHKVFANNFLEKQTLCNAGPSMGLARFPPTPPPTPPATPIRAALAISRKAYTDILVLCGGQIVNIINEA